MRRRRVARFLLTDWAWEWMIGYTCGSLIYGHDLPALGATLVLIAGGVPLTRWIDRRMQTLADRIDPAGCCRVKFITPSGCAIITARTPEDAAEIRRRLGDMEVTP